jgi:predicted PurR-regulated permease PerM
MISSDSPIIHPANAGRHSPEEELAQRRVAARFDAVPLAIGAIGLLALGYLVEKIVSPFVVIVAIYMVLTPFREYRAARTMMWTSGFLFVLWFLVTLAPLLVPFILGALLAYLFNPLITLLESLGLPWAGGVPLFYYWLYRVVELSASGFAGREHIREDQQLRDASRGHTGL